MALTGDQVESLTAGTVGLYRAAERALLQRVTANLAAGIDSPSWVTDRLASVGAVRAALDRILTRVGDAAAGTIREQLAAAYRQGHAVATAQLPRELFPDDDQVAGLAGAIEGIPRLAVVENLAVALVADIAEKHSAVLRRATDVYRSVIAEAASVSVAGGMSRREAAQYAYQRFLDQGVTSFTDVSGRRWRLSSYAEMATRTVTQRAAVQGQTDRLSRSGVDTVVVSDSPRECPLCAPWEGKILSISGALSGRVELESMVGDGMVTVDVAGSVAGARAAGLQHPNCTHALRAWLPGTAKPAPAMANPEGYEAKQRQRALERQIRHWREREAGALTSDARLAARKRVKSWEARLREHLKAHPELKRLRYRERVGAGNIADTPPPKVTLPTTPPAAPPPPPPPPPSTAAMVLAGDFSGLTRVGPQGGSNPGGLFEAADGSRWYVKVQRSEAHADNEVVASALYRETGIDAPEVIRGQGLAELGDGPMTATRWLDGAVADGQARLTDPDWLTEVRRGFAIDTWLSNWDVAGLSFDNIVTVNGKPLRIDQGGSLRFRAQGEPKGDAFGRSVVEWVTLRDSTRSPQASRIFGGMTTDEIVASVEPLRRLKPARIRALVSDVDLADLLVARRADVLARARRLAAPKPATYADRVKKALQGVAALASAPLRLPPRKSRVEGAVPADWSPATVDGVSESLSSYRGSGYEAINDSLRAGSLSDPMIRGRIKFLDQALERSTLPSDVVTWRGIKRPGLVFGASWGTGTNIVGLEWTEKAFVSSSTDKRVADNFAAGQVVMRILVPGGTPGVRLSDQAPASQAPSGISEEAEILMARGLKFRIVADQGYNDGARTIDVELIKDD